MQALGIHTYAGGMQIGVSRVFDTVGSAESWKDCYGIRRHMKLPTLSISEPQNVDLVFANPPCSRFSMASMIRFDETDRNELDQFDCLKEVLGFAIASNARTLWWESGPLAFNRGDGIIKQIHEQFEARTTWILRIDPRDVGIPQKRPRAHVIHFRDDVGAPPIIETKIMPHVRDWLAERCSKDGTPAGPSDKEMREWGCNSPEMFCEVYDSLVNFNSFKPRIIVNRYAHPVLSRAQALDGKWLTIEEQAALMGYPACVDTFDEHWKEILRLLSKSVSSNISELIAGYVHRAMAATDGARPSGRAPAIWALEVKQGDLRRRA